MTQGRQTPLLILSDAIAGSTGLGRIARDLAVRIHAHLPQHFRVATLGVGGAISTSSRFPFPNYSIRHLDSGSAHSTPPLGLLPLDLPTVWEDFAGRYGDGRFADSEDDLQRVGQLRRGILLTIWNVSWCGWLGRPDWLPQGHPLRQFLQPHHGKTPAHLQNLIPRMQERIGGFADLADCPVERWLYCPVDGHCPDGTLGPEVAPILAGFDRLLAYTRYGSAVMEKTLRKWAGKLSPQVPYLPHGIDTSVFYPRDRVQARQDFILHASRGQRALPLRDDQLLLGAVATNTPRKDWGLAFETCAELLSRGRPVFLWCHTDNLSGGYWHLPALAKLFGMENRVVMTTERFDDEEMSWLYSACDCILGIGSGGGFEFPHAEALACAIPVIHGDYAGGAEFLPDEFLVPPQGYRMEGRWAINRPVFRAKDWADKIENAITTELATLPKFIHWQNAWSEWAEWLTSENKPIQSAQPALEVIPSPSVEPV